MLIKIVQLQHTSFAIQQYRALLRKLGIPWQEEYVRDSEQLHTPHWKVTTEKDTYICQTLSACFEQIIRLETSAYILRFALCKLQELPMEE